MSVQGTVDPEHRYDGCPLSVLPRYYLIFIGCLLRLYPSVTF